MKLRILTLTSAVLLVGAGLLGAQTSVHPAPPQQPAGGSMMDECKAMMAKRQAMMDQMKAMDAKLDALVQAMNEAQGSQKVDATAAVVTELVAQHKAMQDRMHSMQPMMMRHMMKHVETGSMGQCPMMQGEKPKKEGHENHH